MKKQKMKVIHIIFDTKEIKIIEGILELLNYATGLNDIVGKNILEGLENFKPFLLPIYLVGDIRQTLKSIDIGK